MIHEDGIILYLGLIEGVGEEELVFPEEGDVLIFDMSIVADVEVIEVYVEITLHYKLL